LSQSAREPASRDSILQGPVPLLAPFFGLPFFGGCSRLGYSFLHHTGLRLTSYPGYYFMLALTCSYFLRRADPNAHFSPPTFSVAPPPVPPFACPPLCPPFSLASPRSPPGPLWFYGVRPLLGLLLPIAVSFPAPPPPHPIVSPYLARLFFFVPVLCMPSPYPLPLLCHEVYRVGCPPLLGTQLRRALQTSMARLHPLLPLSPSFTPPCCPCPMPPSCSSNCAPYTFRSPYTYCPFGSPTRVALASPRPPHFWHVLAERPVFRLLMKRNVFPRDGTPPYLFQPFSIDSF